MANTVSHLLEFTGISNCSSIAWRKTLFRVFIHFTQPQMGYNLNSAILKGTAGEHRAEN